MSTPLPSDLAPEDLLVRARRNELLDHERRKLRELLEASKELELLYLAGVELDRSSALVAGDEARMRRLVEFGRTQRAEPARARSSIAKRRSSRAARSTAITLGVGVALGAAVSAAFQLGSTQILRPAPSAPAGSVMAPSAPKRSPMADSARPVSTVVDDLPDSSPAPSAAPRDSSARRAQAAGARAADIGASALFAKASEARRGGDIDTAVRLYEQLRTRYPDSVEAADARVSLGKLKLHQHAAAEALQHFEDYPPGALSAEALWGQAEALRQMSSPSEGAALERIVREFPDSPYALAARRRLEARP